MSRQLNSRGIPLDQMALDHRRMSSANRRQMASNRSPETNMSEELDEVRRKFSSLPVFRGPQWIIKNVANGDFSIVEEVLDQISQIDLTVNVIAITGPYRSGKSYLMNRLAKAKDGFTVGNGVNAETKGIWGWCLMHPLDKKQVLLLLDTEGIGDTVKDDQNNDNKLLCITALICSTFIYNVKGVIDRETLDKLGFVTFFAKNIRVEKDNANSSGIGSFLPRFVLCLRDFSHDLRSESPSEYLERCLKLQEVSGANDHTHHNQIRKSIQQFFRDRECFVFDTPAAGRVKLASLESIPDKDILDTFLKDTHKFIQAAYQYQPKELLDGKYMNGNMFTSIVKSYVRQINSGEVKCIRDVLSTMATQENRIILKKVVQRFLQEIESIQLPFYDLQEFNRKHEEKKSDALLEFKKRCYLQIDEELFKEIEKDMHSICKKAVKSNIKKQKEQCKSALKAIYDLGIKKRMDEGHYKNVEGYFMFKRDTRKLESDIKQKFPKMDETLFLETFIEFEFTNRADEILAIQMTDKNKKEMKDEYERKEIILTEKYERDRKEQEEKFNKWRDEIEKGRREEVASLNKKWQDTTKQVTSLQNMLRKEVESNGPSASKTARRIVSSFLPFVGPAINDAYERSVHSKRMEDLEKSMDTL